jgi:hypothetical protein
MAVYGSVHPHVLWPAGWHVELGSGEATLPRCAHWRRGCRFGRCRNPIVWSRLKSDILGTRQWRCETPIWAGRNEVEESRCEELFRQGPGKTETEGKREAETMTMTELARRDPSNL